MFAVIFAVWIALWASFIMRELFRKGYFHDYKALLSRGLEGKQSYVTGDRFYEFLTFCNANLPKGATFNFVGVEEGSIDIRRAVYYLYPRLENADPEFILVYDASDARKAGYERYLKLDDRRYILKKRRP